MTARILWPWPADDPRRFMRTIPSRLLPIGLDAEGRKLCAWCPAPIPKGRLRYCSEACAQEALWRMSPLAALEAVGERDGWRCAKCGQRLIQAARARRLARNAISWAEWKRGEDASEATWRFRWDAGKALEAAALAACVPFELDHVVPVSEGGGGCGLEGFRLLCRKPCHAEESGALRRRLNAARSAQLQLTADPGGARS